MQLPDGNDQARVNMILEMYRVAESVQRAHTSRWKRNYEFYSAIDLEYQKKQPHQSKIVVPLSYQIIETSTPQLVLSLLSQDPIYSVNPQSNDDPYKARAAEALLSWQVRQMKNVMLEHTLWIKDSRIYGTAIAKTGWDYQCEYVTRHLNTPPIIDFATGSISQTNQTYQEKIVTSDNPIMKNIDIGEFYPDPTATSIEDCKFIIHRMMVPYVYLQKMQALQVYKNIEQISRSSSTQVWASDFASRRFSVNNIDDPFKFQLPLYDYVELLETWWIDPSHPQFIKFKTTVADRRYIIQDLPLADVYWHNRWPFVMLKNTPMTNEFWSMSEIDITYSLQKEHNSLRNQNMDNINATLKAFWLVSNASGINKEKLKRLAPGDVLKTNDINGIKIERPPALDNLTFNALMNNMSDIQKTANIGDMVTGTPTRSQIRNATTATLMNENTKNRAGLSALLHLEQMRRIGQDWLALNQQFLTDQVVVEILGEDGLPIKYPVDATTIPRNPDVFVTLGMELQGNKDLKRELMIKMDAIMAQTPNVNITQWRKDMLKEYGFKNPERYFEGEFVTPTEAFFGGKSTMQQSSFLDQFSTNQTGMQKITPFDKNMVGDQMEGVYGRLGG